MKKMVIFIVTLVITSMIIMFSNSSKQELEHISLDNNLDNLVGVYLENEDGEYETSSDIPQKGSGYQFNKVVCENDVEAEWNEESWSLIVPNNVVNFKCNLYFDKAQPIKDILLTYYPKVLTRTDFSTIVTDTTTGTIYKSADNSQFDDDGEVYYFAGNPQDNWVKFAGYYWRIIRINGDGSLRIIYNGTSPITTGANTQIGTSAFNTAYHSNEYVGYMYTGMEVHGISNSSAVKLKLDEWYKLNIVDQRYMDYIDLNAGFCNDRTPSSGNGLSISSTKYALYDRLTNVGKPTFKCSHQDDLFTVATSNKGNKALQYPIGLITGDEVWYAGGGAYNYTNNSYYLYTSSSYWTMSPSSFGSSYAYVFYVNHLGDFSAAIVDGTFGVGIRPVINLKSNVHISDGNGLADSPFLIS